MKLNYLWLSLSLASLACWTWMSAGNTSQTPLALSALSPLQDPVQEEATGEFETCSKYQLTEANNDQYGRYADGHVFYFPQFPVIDAENGTATASNQLTLFGLGDSDELFLSVADGSASITGSVTIYSGENIGTTWDVNIELTPSTDDSCDPKNEFRASANALLSSYENFWQYYTINTDGASYLELQNTEIRAEITNEMGSYCLQLGLGGNNKNLGLGLSDWFQWQLVSVGEQGNEVLYTTSSHADINVDASCVPCDVSLLADNNEVNCDDTGLGTVMLNLNNIDPTADLLNIDAVVDGQGPISDSRAIQSILPAETNILNETGTVRSIMMQPNASQVEVKLPIGQYNFTVQSGSDAGCTSQVAVSVVNDKFNASPAIIPDEVNCNFDDNHVFWVPNFPDLTTPTQRSKTIFSLGENDQLFVTTQGNNLVLQGNVTAQSGQNVGTNWEANITFTPREDIQNGKFECGLIPNESKDFFQSNVWDFYEIDENASTLTHTDGNDLYTLSLSNLPNQFTQVGVGANGKNYNNGLSTWFNWSLEKDGEGLIAQSTSHADINVDLACTNECPLQLASDDTDATCDDETGLGSVMLNLSNVLAGQDGIHLNAVVEGHGVISDWEDLLNNTPATLNFNGDLALNGATATIQNTQTINPQIALQLPVGQYTFEVQRNGDESCTSQLAVNVANDNYSVLPADKSTCQPNEQEHVFWMRGFPDLEDIGQKATTFFALSDTDQLSLIQDEDSLYMQGNVTVLQGKNMGSNWTVNMKFTPRTDLSQGKFECNVVPAEDQSFLESEVWKYYEIDEEESYIQHTTDTDLYRVRFKNMSNYTQVGVGANAKNYNNGLSTWFGWSLERKTNDDFETIANSTQHGDINVDLVCPAEPMEEEEEEVCEDMYPKCGDNFSSYNMTDGIVMKPEKMDMMFNQVAPTIGASLQDPTFKPQLKNAIFKCYKGVEEGELGAEIIAVIRFCGQDWKLKTTHTLQYDKRGRKVYEGSGQLTLKDNDNVVCHLPYVKLMTFNKIRTPEGMVHQAVRMNFKWTMGDLKGWNSIVFPLEKVCSNSIFIKSMECSRKKNRYQRMITNLDPFFAVVLKKANGRTFRIKPGATRNLFTRDRDITCYVDGQETTLTHDYEYGNQRCASSDYSEKVMNAEDDIDWDEEEIASFATSTIHKASNLKAYPNPTQGSFTLEAQGNNSRIEIFTPSGKKVYDLLFSNSLKREIDLNEFGKGIFIIRMTTQDVQTIEKIVIN